MKTMFICHHHTFYGYQENEYIEIGMLTDDVTKARAWCDNFKPIFQSGEICEWRTYTALEINKDYTVSIDYDPLLGSACELNPPRPAYTQDTN